MSDHPTIALLGPGQSGLPLPLYCMTLTVRQSFADALRIRN